MLRVNTRMDLNTNAGTLSSRQQCTVLDFENFKEVWFKNAMTNILSFARRDLGYTIEYDSVADTFTVDTPSKK